LLRVEESEWQNDCYTLVEDVEEHAEHPNQDCQAPLLFG
jgi:hypothetical protein